MKKILNICMILAVILVATFAFEISANAEPVDVSDISKFQSAHPYSNNMDQTWVYTHQTDAENLGITFSSDTETESGYDYIYIYDGNDSVIGKYDGTSLANKTIIVPGNIVKIKLTSDGSLTGNGFTVTNIKENMSQSDIPTTIVAHGTCGDNLKWTLDDYGTLTISGYGTISWEYPWYYYSADIKSVVIETGVTGISGGAFEYCENLISITIPYSVSYIDDYAFYGCNSITDIYYGGTSDNWYYLGDGISGLLIPDNTTMHFRLIINDPFGENLWCTLDGNGLLTISGTGSMDTWWEYPWCNYIADIKSVAIEDGVTTIGDSAFYYCDSLASVIIPDSVTNIGSSAFSDCDSLTDITIGDGVTNIGGSAFSDCDSLTSITIPDSVTSIGNSAFSSCESLTSVTIGDSVTSIGSWAFSYCDNLTSITIGNGITSIGDFAFYECTSLESVYITDISAWCNIDFYSYNSNPFYYAKNLYLNNELVNDLVISDSITNISDYAFSGCSSLTSVTIPDSITSIGITAFSSCENLTSITVDEDNPNYSSVNGILFNKDKNTIIQCPGGKSEVIVEDYVTSIEDRAFQGCASLKRIIWNTKNITGFSDTAQLFLDAGTKFGGIKVVFSEGIELIPERIFYKCKSIISVTVPESVTKIGYDAFYDCAYLEELIWNTPISPRDACIYAGKSGNGINVIIGEGIERIPDSAFYKCSNIKSVIIPDTVTSIGDDAFNDCDRLTSITIPGSVTSMEFCAIYSCPKLDYIYYSGTWEQWNKIYDNKYMLHFDHCGPSRIRYIRYVIILNKDENVIIKKMLNLNDVFDLSDIELEEGESAKLYLDKELTLEYDTSLPVTENITLYMESLKVNQLEVCTNVSSAEIGTKGIAVGSSFATDKDAYAMMLTVKYPDCLSVSEIQPIDFELVEESENIKTVNGYTYLSLICYYKGTGANMPKATTLTPFELIFDISETAVPQEAQIEFTEDSVLVGAVDYSFDKIINGTIEITPKLAESIVITGLDTISEPTQYIAEVLPNYTSNKEVEWTVSDETVATVSEDGILTPIKKGELILTATAKDGSGVTASKIITINEFAKIDLITSDKGSWDKAFDSYVKDYTIYVDEDETEITLTPTFVGGTLRINGALHLPGRAKTITLSEETEVTLTRTGVTDSEDSTYTIKIVKKSFTKTTVSENTFTVKPINIESGSSVILACYKNNKLSEIQTAEYMGEELIFNTENEYDKVYVFVWNNLGNMTSLTDGEKVK